MLASQMTQRLILSTTFEEAVHIVLDDVIALLGAEYGNVQLSIGDELVIAAQRGLSADFLKTFRRVKKDDGSACGRVACTRFRRHRVRCFHGTGGASWRGGSLHESSSLRRCA
jgi:hypothetical protein